MNFGAVNAQQVDVGVDVGLPTLSSAIQAQVIQPINGVIGETIICKGNFSIDQSYEFNTAFFSLDFDSYGLPSVLSIDVPTIFISTHVSTGGYPVAATGDLQINETFTFRDAVIWDEVGVQINSGSFGAHNFENSHFYQTINVFSADTEINIVNCSFHENIESHSDANIFIDKAQFHDGAYLNSSGENSEIEIINSEFRSGNTGIKMRDGLILKCTKTKFRGNIGIECDAVSAGNGPGFVVVNDCDFRVDDTGIDYQTGKRLIVMYSDFLGCTKNMNIAPDVTDHIYATVYKNNFLGGGSKGLTVEEANNVLIEDNIFQGGNSPDGAIFLDEIVGGRIIDNEFSSSHVAVNISKCDGTIIRDNIINQPNNNLGFPGVINVANESKNILVDNNQVLNGSPFACLNVNQSAEVKVVNNVFENGIDNIHIRQVTSSEFGNNQVLNGSQGIFSTKSPNVTFTCNNIQNSTSQGVYISGNHIPLSYALNNMEDCGTGLYYSSNAMADRQIQQGNTWDGNTVGAKNDNPRNDDRDDAKYIVPDPAVYPGTVFAPSSVDPQDWFEYTSQNYTGFNCFSFPPGGFDDQDINGIQTPEYDEIIALENAIDCNGDTLIPGYCMVNQMLANSVLDEFPEYLNQSPTLNTFYTSYSSSLPSFMDILASVPDFNYVYDVPDVIVDVDTQLVNLEVLKNYSDSTLNNKFQHKLLRDSLLTLWLQSVNAASTQNNMEGDYKDMLSLYLDQLVNDYALTNQDSIDVKALAELCVRTEGPAVYVARVIAENNRINYTLDPNCDNYSRATVSEQDNVVNSYYPNPTMGSIVYHNPESINQLKLLNTMGQTLNVYDLRNKASIQIDLSHLNSGIYFLKSKERLKVDKIMLQK